MEERYIIKVGNCFVDFVGVWKEIKMRSDENKAKVYLTEDEARKDAISRGIKNFKIVKKSKKPSEKGWTIVFTPWEDVEGREHVAKRCRTDKEKDDYLNKIHQHGTGWLEEELNSLRVINDYNYMLER